MAGRTTHNERIQALEDSIHGNGAIGIKQQLQEIRDNQKRFQKFYWMGLGAVTVLSPVISKLIITFLN